MDFRKFSIAHINKRIRMVCGGEFPEFIDTYCGASALPDNFIIKYADRVQDWGYIFTNHGISEVLFDEFRPEFYFINEGVDKEFVMNYSHFLGQLGQLGSVRVMYHTSSLRNAVGDRRMDSIMFDAFDVTICIYNPSITSRAHISVRVRRLILHGLITDRLYVKALVGNGGSSMSEILYHEKDDDISMDPEIYAVLSYFRSLSGEVTCEDMSVSNVLGKDEVISRDGVFNYITI